MDWTWGGGWGGKKENTYPWKYIPLILGLKYVLAVRDDMSDTVLRLVYPTIERHLTDESDDVVAVAASGIAFRRMDQWEQSIF